MADMLPERVTGIPPPSATDHPPPPPSRWWTQLHSLFFLRNKILTAEEKCAMLKPFLLSVFTGFLAVLAVNFIMFFSNWPHCHVSFSVESISVFPSSATWKVQFLVKNPTSRCHIYYDGDDVYAKLDPINAAVLNTSHTHTSSGLTKFSMVLATEGNQSDVVAASPRVFELDIKLNAMKKTFMKGDQIGHFDIRCQNLMIGHEKIKCHSSFKDLEPCC